MAAITEAQLLPVLQGTLSNNPDERYRAETVLAEYGQLEGYCFSLLKIAAADQIVDSSVRQASAICLKNTVKKRWTFSVHTPEANRKPGEFPIQPSDKANLMSHLQECVIRSPPLVRAQLLECVKEIVALDYPQPWNGLLPEMILNLQSKDVLRINGALLVMRTVARRLEFMHDLRSILEDFASAALPVLLPLLQGLLAENSVSEELATMMKTILKIFWSCIYVDIPNILTQEAQCRAWLDAILALMKRPVPAEGQHPDPVERQKNQWWKLKKWIMGIARRLSDRYGDPRITVSQPAHAFAEIFKAHYATNFLLAVMQMLEDVAKGTWYSPRVLISLSHYVEASIKPPEAYKLLEPYLIDILTHAILPQCFFTEANQLEWETDPMEVIRKNSSSGCFLSVEELYDPCNAAVMLITKVMDSKKSQARCLDPFMECVIGIAKAFRAAHDANAAGVPADIARKMDGVALVIGMLLDDVLTTKRNAKYRDNLEFMIQQYLLPLFASSYGHLRAKGCWLAGKFAVTYSFSQADGSKAKGKGALFDELLTRVLNCMQDPDLPVQVEAVIAFRDFVEALADADRLNEKLHPILSDLLRHLFHLASMVEATDIVTTLEKIVESIGEEIQPFAIDVCQQLVVVYHKLLCEKDSEDDAGDIFEASMSISGAIITILEACSSLPETISQLEGLLMPMMEQMCDKSCEEMFDQVCEMLTYFTYFVTPISQRTWAFWPRLHAILKDWGIDFVENIIVPLDNMICKGTDTFCTSQNPNYRESVYDMVQYCLKGDFSEMEVAPATKLLEIVLLNCKGRVDEWVWPYIELAMGKIDSVKDSGFATLCMNIIPAALVYNPHLTLQLLEQHGKTSAVFTLWFKMLQDEKQFFRRIHDKKLTCVGLTALFPLQDGALPAPVQQALPQVLSTVLRLLKLLKEQEEAQSDSEDSESDGDSAGAHDGGEDYEDVDEGDLDEDALYLQGLQKTAARLRRAKEDEPIDWGEWTDDEEIESALDDIDAFDWLASTLRDIQSHSPQRFQDLVGSLDETGKNGLQELIQFAHIRQAQKEESSRKRTPQDMP